MSPPATLYGVRVSSVRGTTPIAIDPCPVCAQRTAVPRFEVEGLASKIVVCRGCGLGQFAPRLDADRIRTFYPEEYYGNTGRKFEGAVEWLVRIVAARQAQFLSRGLPAGARVLDVGCGRGVMVRAFADRGFEVHGTEISRAAAQGIDRRATLHVAASLREAGLPAQAFDEVVLWHVFEHLPDPRETLLEIRRVLKPGGRMILAVPNFSSLQARWTGPGWFHLDPPRHLFHFPVAALRRLLEEQGFRCVSEHHFSLRQNPFGWVQSLLNLCPALPRNGLYVMLHRNPGCPKPFTRPVRWIFRAAFLLGMPVALGLSVIAAVLRQGATVSIVATLPTDAADPIPAH